MKALYKFLDGVILLIFFGISISLTGCKKFLNEKPDQSITSPQSLEDVQRLLDNYSAMNNNYPNLGMQSDDDFYLTDTYLSGIASNYQLAYKWDKDVVTDDAWLAIYRTVLHSNMCLEVLEALPETNSNFIEKKKLKAYSLFYRSLAFYHAAQIFAMPYDENIGSTAPGICIRLSSDVSTPVIRSSMEDSYIKMIEDLQDAFPDLPQTNFPVSRPSKIACYALLSNIYLNMMQYDMAGLYADSALRIDNTVIDYNSISSTASIPFSQFNREVFFSSGMSGQSRFNQTNMKVDSVLYSSYALTDLRKKLFFRQSGSTTQFGFKGNYQGNTTGNLFNGFTTAEMILIRAEVNARKGLKDSAMADLNRLLLKRFTTNTFVPYTASTSEDAVSIILKERRKELLGRGRRWYDLRRLNRETGRSVTIKRIFQNQLIELPAGDKRYTFYLPDIVVQQNNIVQNER